MKRVTIDFPEETYRVIKAFSAFNDLSVRNFVLNAVNNQLIKEKIKIPNKETLSTFQETDAEKNFEKYQNFNELLEDLTP